MAGGQMYLAASPAIQKSVRTVRTRKLKRTGLKKKIPVRASTYPKTGFPNSMLMRHKYVSGHSSGNIGNISYSRIFRLNSLFDPDLTGVGHQPYYRDEMTALYHKYTVFGCMVVIKANAIAGTGIVGMKSSRDSAAITSAVTAVEKPNVKYMMIATGAKPATIRQYFPLNMVYGVSKSAVANDDLFSAVASTNPTSVANIKIFGQSADSATTFHFDFTVELTYLARWRDKITVQQS